MKTPERKNMANQLIRRARKDIAKHLGLPLKSVRLELPSGKLPGPNKTVGQLRRDWD